MFWPKQVPPRFSISLIMEQSYKFDFGKRQTVRFFVPHQTFLPFRRVRIRRENDFRMRTSFDVFVFFTRPGDRLSRRPDADRKGSTVLHVIEPGAHNFIETLPLRSAIIYRDLYDDVDTTSAGLIKINIMFYHCSIKLYSVK